MSSFIERLAKQRLKFLDGLDANEGDINLDIFEDFYPDQAHFVFELLQNAEDAGATKAAFTLLPDGCRFEHNGTRDFTEADVRAITGIHNSTKNKVPDQIGKFGVGFKSVFVYTLSPIIHSGEFSFRISRLVLPEPVEPDSDARGKTLFWLPFNNPKKTPEAAYAEVEAGLRELAETTLLFLTHLEAICWEIGQDSSGDVLRIQHSDYHFEVLKQSGGETTSTSHFLKFDQPVEGLEKQRVAVAFALDFMPGVQQFDSKKPLGRQLRVIPASPGTVAVFFPAEKETSGLRFHLHAPFVPELIPSPENSRAPVPRIVSIGQDRLGVGITPGAGSMFVQNHHSLEELQRLTKALTKKRIWLRHQAVVLAKQGHSAPAIARALGCSHRAVQAWVGRYNQGGLAALQERPHTGRPPRLAAADVPRFRDRLEAGPTPEDGVCTFRCQDVHRILEEEFGVSCAGRRSMTCCIASITAA